MSALLRADWLRLRRRRELWVIVIAVLLLSALAFFAAYRSDVADPEWFVDEAQLRQEAIEFNFFEGTPNEVQAQIDQYVRDGLAQNEQNRQEWERQQETSLQKYAFPQSIFTILGSAMFPILALVLIASLTVGDEFRYGTIRTSLLAAGDRRRFLVARLVSLFALSVGLLAALALIGAAFGALLGTFGADLGKGSTPIHAPSAVAWFGAQVLMAAVLVAFATALAVLLRSGALPLLILVLVGLIELFVAHLPIFAERELLWGVPQALLSTNLLVLGPTLGLASHALALVPDGAIPRGPFDVPLPGVAAIVVAYGLLFVAIADRRMRTMDVVE
jgi:hypothetical protein